ncbi:MAG: hypothetical protein EKK41_18140 [Hyphomicrobiales bacterium]|nr:MAG: hypothetical protein EKK41_18140 [Hyphomicrobiales bacterium]
MASVKIQKSLLARLAAQSKQLRTFLAHRTRPDVRLQWNSIAELYRASVQQAFDSKAPFIVTGAPHAAYYPRNFACFYPDLLDPVTIIDAEDAANRSDLLVKSVALICSALKAGVHTTTLVPITSHSIVGINYFASPSDTLLGLLAALKQLLAAGDYADGRFAAIYARAANEGRAIRAAYAQDIAEAVERLATELVLHHVAATGADCLLCDSKRPRSAVTDARAERARFVTNANVWTTFSWAIDLDFVDLGAIERKLGRTLQRYKRELFAAFAPNGFVLHSLEPPAPVPSHNISLDFAHIRNGFWDMNEPGERSLFRNTAEHILRDPKFWTQDRLLVVSIKRPRERLIHRVLAPGYQGRNAWPALNVEFADRLLDLARWEGPRYSAQARSLLRAVVSIVARHGGYPELIAPDGAIYRTWGYQSALAHSWFPRFASVAHRTNSQVGAEGRASAF